MVGNSGGQLGNYRLLRQLGYGGSADVYLGEHVYLHTPAAIKVLRTRLTEEDSEKFRQEALLIAHLTHPYIIRVLDFNIEHAEPFLVMEYASGGTLRQHFPRGTRVPLTQILPYVGQLASALQYAHDRKLIHRDVKPENMLLSDEGTVKLSDFGIAAMVHNTLSQETTEHITGTMPYMAPEQLQGKARPASDQYSLAIVIYEWLTGRLPFQGSYMEILTQHLTTPPPSLDEEALAIPHAVTQVLRQALAKEPHRRFPSVEEFAAALASAYQTGQSPTLFGDEGAGVAGERGMSVPPLEPTIPAEPAVQPVLPPAELPRGVDAPAAHWQISPPREQAQAVVAQPALPRTEPQFVSPASGPPKMLPGIVHALGSKLSGCARTFVVLVVVLPLLLCGLGFAGYSYISSRGSPAQAAALTNDFVAALAHQNYTQAYRDMGSSITNTLSHSAFGQQAQAEDRCYGSITAYQEVNSSTSNGAQVYDYAISRTRLSRPYTLHVTVTRDFWGNWSISDYNSNVAAGNSSCG